MVGFLAGGEVQVLPVNHLVDGQDVIFRTAHGSKLYATQGQQPITFEADDYDEETHSGWSVVMNGRAEPVDEEAEVDRLGRAAFGRGSAMWSGRSGFRIRPTSVTGRRIPQAT